MPSHVVVPLDVFADPFLRASKEMMVLLNSRFNVAKKDSEGALSQQFPVRLMLNVAPIKLSCLA
jgi:hypothetical protein